MEARGDGDVKQRKQQNKLNIWDKDDYESDIIALFSSLLKLFLFGQRFAAFCHPL